jgi:hypothetical protein
MRWQAVYSKVSDNSKLEIQRALVLEYRVVPLGNRFRAPSQVTRTIHTNRFQMNQRAHRNPRKKVDTQVNEGVHKPRPDAIDTTVPENFDLQGQACLIPTTRRPQGYIAKPPQEDRTDLPREHIKSFPCSHRREGSHHTNWQSVTVTYRLASRRQTVGRMKTVVPSVLHSMDWERRPSRKVSLCARYDVSQPLSADSETASGNDAITEQVARRILKTPCLRCAVSPRVCFPHTVPVPAIPVDPTPRCHPYP